MEKLDYLIRTITYQRSRREIQLKNVKTNNDFDLIQGEIEGLNFALNEIYKLISENN